MACDKTSIGDRFKRYEQVSDTSLVRRMPVIIRVDGRSFHRVTKHMDKPFDANFMFAMMETALALCAEIQGAKLAYVQSDEISVLVTDYDTIETQAWFDYRVQKMCSVSAYTAANAFNNYLSVADLEHYEEGFDARCFNVPENDVANYFIWRQKDAIRNSVSMQAQAHFSPKALHGKKRDDMLAMLKEKGEPWEDLPVRKQRGLAVFRAEGKWCVENETPMFTDNRNYIERLLPNG